MFTVNTCTFYDSCGSILPVGLFQISHYIQLACLYSDYSEICCGRAMALPVSRWSVTAGDRVRFKGIPYGIFDGENGTGTSLCKSIAIFSCLYHSTNAPYSFIHLPLTLYNVFLPVLQFPLSVSFHQRSILIHSSTTNAV
jgi:hypothetical protein